jgi:hypothetical protein
MIRAKPPVEPKPNGIGPSRERKSTFGQAKQPRNTASQVKQARKPPGRGAYHARRREARDRDDQALVQAMRGAPEGSIGDWAITLLWRAHAEGLLAETDAQALSEAVEARRARIKAGRPQPLPSLSTARRRPPRSPDRRASIERRRRTAASGALPPQIASRFTQGEVAALAVIGREVQRAGRCDLYIDAIAATAGTCRSIVQSATREAARLGIIKVTERRIPGRKSLSNLVEVISPEWRAWLAIGFRKTNATVIPLETRAEIALRSTAKRESDAPSARTSCFRGGGSLAEACGGGTKGAFEGVKAQD